MTNAEVKDVRYSEQELAPVDIRNGVGKMRGFTGAHGGTKDAALVAAMRP